MLHRAADVRLFGPDDGFSAFQFENYLQFVIKLVLKGDKPLQQLARRYSELSSFTKEEKKMADSGTFLFVMWMARCFQVVPIPSSRCCRSKGIFNWIARQRRVIDVCWMMVLQLLKILLSTAAAKWW